MVKILELYDELEKLTMKYNKKIDKELETGNMSEEDIRNLYDINSISYAVYESRFFFDKTINSVTNEEEELYFVKSEVEKVRLRTLGNIEGELALYLKTPADTRAFMNAVKMLQVVDQNGKYHVDRMVQALSYSKNYKNDWEKAKSLENDVINFLITDRLYSKKSYRMVSLYNNNGESVEGYKNKMPKKLIGFSYIDDGDIDTSNEQYNIAINALLGGTPGIAKHVGKYSSGLVKTFFEKITAHLSKIDGSLKDLAYTYSASELAGMISKEREIIDKDILDFKKSGNLNGMSDQEAELVNTLSFIASALAIAIPTGTAAISIMAVGAAVGGGISYFTEQLKKSMSKENGIFELNRYKELIGSDEGINIFPEFTDKKIDGKIDFGLHTVVANSLVQNRIQGSEEDDYIKVIAGNDNFLNGKGGNDILIGSKNVDTLIGWDGNDQLTGGQGDDTLKGGKGNDVYIYRTGDGNDTITEESVKVGDANNNKDTLILSDFELKDVNIFQEGHDLIIINKVDSNDKITIKNQFSISSIGKHSSINFIKFKGEESVKVNDFFINDLSMGRTRVGKENIQNLMYGNGGNDTLKGGNQSDIIYGDDYENKLIGVDYLYGYEGNDMLYGGKGNDMLFGGDNNDTLYGGDDDDRLYGGTGEDKLYGQKGNDTYVVRAGDGLTTIVDEFGNDTLDLSDFEFDEVDIYRDILNPSRLRIKSNDVSDGNAIDITIKNYFTSQGNFGGKSIDLVKFKNQEPSSLFTNYKLKASENEIVDFTTIDEKDLEVSNGISDIGSNKSNSNENTITVDAVQKYMAYSRKDKQLIIKAHDSNWNLIDTKKVENFFSEINDVYTPNNDNKYFISFTDNKNIDLSDVWRTGIEEHWIVDEKSWIEKDTTPDSVIPDILDNNEISVGESIQMGLISERENNAGCVTGRMINDKALYKFTDVGKIILGEHTSSSPKWQWITGIQSDKRDSRVEFNYGNDKFKLYVNTGKLIKNNKILMEEDSDLAVYNGKTMISQAYINAIFGMKSKEEKNKMYSIDSDKNSKRYSDLYDLSLSQLNKEEFSNCIDNLSVTNPEDYSDEIIGIGNTVIISRNENSNFAKELYAKSYLTKNSDDVSKVVRGYELASVLKKYGNRVFIKEQSNNFFRFKFNGKEVSVNHIKDKPFVLIDNKSIELKTLPVMKDNKLMISPELLMNIFDLKHGRLSYSGGEKTLYLIDENKSLSGIADLLGNEFYNDGNKFVVSKKHETSNSSHTPVDEVYETLDRIREIAGNEDNVDVDGGSSVHGTDKNEEFYGDDVRNKIYGKGGHDYVEGNDGRDILHGDDGNDVLDGGGDNDLMYGGRGDDVFLSSGGKDYFRGEHGSDIYVIDGGESHRINDSVNYGQDEGTDLILFEDGDIKTMRLIEEDSNLKIFLDPDNDKKYVSILRFFESEAYRPEEYAFSNDNVLWKVEDIINKFVEQNSNFIVSGTQNITYYKGMGTKEFNTVSISHNLTIHKATTIDMTSIDLKDCEFITDKTKADLVINIKNTEDSIVIKDYFLNLNAYVDTIEFKNELIWTKEELSKNASNTVVFLTENNNDYRGNTATIVDHIKGNNQDNKIWTYGGNDVVDGGVGNDFISGGKGNDLLHGGGGDDTLVGSEGSDKLYGDQDNDTLIGGLESDYLYGGTGDDVLIGSTGNDHLYGGTGENIYKFSKGFGQDIVHIDPIDSKDIITFDDINSDEVILKREDKDLVILIKGTDDNIRIFNCYDGYKSNLKGITFANHITMSEDQILKVPQKIIGTDYSENIAGTVNHDAIFGNAGDDILSGGMNNDELYGGLGKDKLYGEDGEDYLSGGLGNDTLSGGAHNDTLSGGAHNDHLMGNKGNDKLLGGSGNDVMEGNDGNDTLIGNTGIDSLFGGDGDDILIGGEHNDYLEGGLGNDIYIFKRGFGQDEISVNNHNVDNKPDIIQFEDISSEEIEVLRTDFSDDLIIKVKDSNNQIRIREYYKSKTAMISHLKFSDKVEWQGIDIAKHTKKLTFDIARECVNNSNLKESGDRKKEYGYISPIFENVENRFLWKTIINGGHQNDYLLGDNSSDILIGGDGNDILDGKNGYDVYTGGEGSDVYIVESGSKIINNYNEENSDVVYFKNSHSNNIDIERQGYNLKITYNQNEHVYINGFFANKKYRPAFYVFENDETVLTEKDIIDKYIKIHGVNIDKENNGDIIKLDKGFGFRELVAVPKDENFNVQTSVRIDMEINSSECRLMKSSDSKYLMLQTKMSDDLLLVKDYFNENDNYIHSIRFSDGVIWDSNYLNNNIKEIAYILTSGRDVVDGKDLADKKIIYSQDGSDELFMKYGKHIIYGGRGDDNISTGAEDDEIYGGSGWDRIWGYDGNDRILGGSGEDRLNGLDGDDYIDGGTDNDEIDGGEGHDTLYGGSGHDRIWGNKGNDIIYGNEGNDFLHGAFGDDKIFGGDGDDIISGNAGKDVFEGGLGKDTYYIVKEEDITVINFNEVVDDKIIFHEINSTEVKVIGLDENKFILGSESGDFEGVYIDYINFEKDDQLTIEFEDDVVWKNDDIFNAINQYIKENLNAKNKLSANVSIEVDDIVGLPVNNDRLYGTDKNDKIYGLSGNDILYSSHGDDQLYGGLGDDELHSGEGFDKLYGGSGNNTYYITGTGAKRIYVATDSQGAPIADSVSDRVVLKSLSSKNAMMSLIQNEFVVTDINVTKGTIINLEHFDEKDSLTIEFSDGVIWTNNYLKNIIEKSNKYLQNSIGGVCKADNQNNIILRNENVKDIYGLGGDDILYGNFESSSLYGGEGNDKLYGGEGNDKLYGGSGDDILYGGSYNDTLNGGSGNDKLYGGSGNNTYILEGDFDTDDIIIESNSTNNVIFKDLTLNDLEVVVTNSWISFYTEEKDEYAAINIKNYSEKTMLDITFADGFRWTNNRIKSILNNSKIIENRKTEYESIFGSRNADIIIGDSGGNKILGENGSDIIYGGYGDDQLYGGQGHDFIKGGRENDILYGDEGSDLLYGGSGDDTIYGGTENDFLYGDIGDDILFGEEGNDILHGEKGYDTLYGGHGNDILYGGELTFYKFNENFGKDSIIVKEDGRNSIEFNHYNKEDIVVFRENQNLIIKKDVNNYITVNHFYSFNKANYRLKYADGTISSYKGDNSIESMVLNSKGLGRHEYVVNSKNDIHFDKLYTDSQDVVKLNYNHAIDSNVAMNEIELKDNLLYDFKVTEESDNLKISYDNNHSFIIEKFFTDVSKQFENLIINNTFQISSDGIGLLVQSMNEYCSKNSLDWTDQNVRENQEMQQIILSSFSSIV
jgi:Ca2+-binding RTX toxin-like protein